MLRNSLNFRQGNIVVVEVPFSDLSGSKLRPLLIVSSNAYNRTSGDIIGAKITGSFYNLPWEVRIVQKDLETGKLKKTSYIDCGFLVTVDKKIIKGVVARIKKEKLSEIMEKIREVLNLKK